MLWWLHARRRDQHGDLPGFQRTTCFCSVRSGNYQLVNQRDSAHIPNGTLPDQQLSSADGLQDAMLALLTLVLSINACNSSSLFPVAFPVPGPCVVAPRGWSPLFPARQALRIRRGICRGSGQGTASIRPARGAMKKTLLHAAGRRTGAMEAWGQAGRSLEPGRSKPGLTVQCYVSM